jgi:DNA-binding MarR family transcriptional regulator
MNKHAREETALPALLRGARRVYGDAVRKALAAAGYDDIPGNGIFVLGAVARAGAPLSEIIGYLGASKQAGGQLVDTLVMRGYLDRETDAQDRRRLTVKLSERGRAAAQIARAAVERVDTQLARRVDRQWITHTRATLQALIEGQHE